MAKVKQKTRKRSAAKSKVSKQTRKSARLNHHESEEESTEESPADSPVESEEDSPIESPAESSPESEDESQNDEEYPYDTEQDDQTASGSLVQSSPDLETMVTLAVSKALAPFLAKQSIDTDKGSSAGSAKSKQRQRKRKRKSRQSSSENESDETEYPPSRKSKVNESSSGSDSDIEEVCDIKTVQMYGILVGQDVPKRIKRKIRTDKYFEFHDLLPSTQFQEEKIALKTTSNGGIQMIKPTSKKFISIEQWNQAFSSYMVIYIDRSQSVDECKRLTQELLTYQRNINNFHKQGLPWYDYDRKFRMDRATMSYTFGTIRQDILLSLQLNNTTQFNKNKAPNNSRYSNTKSQFGGNQNNSFREQSKFGNKTCFTYNAPGKRCQNNRCNYKHSCSKCSGGHPVYLCASDRSQGTESLIDQYRNRALQLQSAKQGVQNRSQQQSYNTNQARTTPAPPKTN